VLALFVFTIWVLNVIGLGVNDTGTPIPDTGSVRDVFPLASGGNVTLTVPLVVPVTVGENSTLKAHIPPAATGVVVVKLQGGGLVIPVVLSLKPAVATGLLTVSEAAPLFVKVTLVAAELLFIGWSGKLTELGVNVSKGPHELQPVPLIFTNCALVGSLSWIASVALCAPSVGLNLMPIEHDEVVPAHVLLTMVKSGSPEIVADVAA